MARHTLGMDNGLYPYSSLPSRPRLRWPDGARLAVGINLFFESMAFDPPPDLARDVRWKERFVQDPRLYTWYDYGNRVAIFRIMEILDRHRLKATVAANADACERFPYLVDAFLKRNWEIAAHGIAANGVITGRLPEAREQSVLSECIERIESATGRRPSGWFGQDYGESVRTPRLLADLNMSYLADWPNDDQPYSMPGAGGIISVPNYVEWDDMRLLWDRRFQMPRYPEIVGEAFDQLHRDGLATGRFFSINLHPWLIGAPHRIKYLETVIEKIAAATDVWQETTTKIVEHVRGGDALAARNC